MPANDRGRLDQHKGTLPALPELTHKHPEQAIRLSEPRPSGSALKDSQLLPQHEVFGEEVTAAAQGRSGSPEEQGCEFQHRVTLPGKLP